MRNRVSLTIRLLAVILFAAPAVIPQTASERAERGPAVGQKIPGFKARDQFGREQSPASLMGSKGLVLLFVRSADWCPYCQEQLVQLQKAQGRFLRQGLTLAAVSYDDAETLKAFAREQHIEYSLIADPQSEIIRLFGLLDANEDTTAIQHPTARKGFALPGFLVVNRQGVVTEKFFGNYFYDRYTANNVIGKLFPELVESSAGPLDAPQLQLMARQSDRDVILGSRITLGVDVMLPPGMHVYAQGQKKYRPIELKVDSVGGVPVESAYLGAASYPQPRAKLLPAINETVPVYEGRFTISRDLVVIPPDSIKLIFDDPSMKDESIVLKVRGRLLYQACDEETCYLPQEVEVTWDLTHHSVYWHSGPGAKGKPASVDD